MAKDVKNPQDEKRVRKFLNDQVWNSAFDRKKLGAPCTSCGEKTCRGKVYYVQETDRSCAIASTRMILRDHGIVFENESDLAGDYNTFNFERVENALRDNGISFTTGDPKSFSDLQKALDGGKNTLILGMAPEGGAYEGHAVVVDGISKDGKNLLVRDPGSDPGCREIGMDELQRRVFGITGLGRAGVWFIAIPN